MLGGVADVLVAGRDGKAPRDFTGRLPFAWPADARSPVAAPLFPAGYGLHYGEMRTLGRVNDDPRIDLSLFDTATSFFVRGKALAPWHMPAAAADRAGRLCHDPANRPDRRRRQRCA